MVPATQARWSEHIRAWKTSGLSCKDYATRAGINPGTLSWYASRLRTGIGKTGASATTTFDGFIEVIAKPRDGRESIEVLTHGASIRIPVGFDDRTLTRILDILEARS